VVRRWMIVFVDVLMIVMPGTASACAGFAMVMDSGKVLYQENANVQEAPASLTKVMTALLVIENGSLDARVTISDRAASVGESSAGLQAGEVYTRKELLYGLLLPSGNDAAVALAESVAGSEGNFVHLMNAEAQRLGMTETHFSDASGLTAPGHYSSAHDLALLTVAAMQYPESRKIVATQAYYLPTTVNHGSHYWENLNLSFLTGYPGAEGVKTGWTTPAGHCVICAAKRGQVELVAVVLHMNSYSMACQDAETLLDKYFGES